MWLDLVAGCHLFLLWSHQATTPSTPGRVTTSETATTTDRAPGAVTTFPLYTETTKVVSTPRVRTTSSTKGSLSAWILSPASMTYVKLYKEEQTWTGARSVCQAEGGDLVKILDQSMNDFVTGTSPPNSACLYL